MTQTIGLATVFATLALFGWVGWRGGREAVLSRDEYLAARGSQTGIRLALSFFASGLGVWILFTPPEVGTFGGLAGIVGYGLAAASPFVVLAWFGPAVRRRLPESITLSEFLRVRFGRTMQIYVGLVSLFYMFIFVTAELTAAGGAVELLSGIDPIVTVVAVAVVTIAYTAYGGLRASLRTDRWQGWAILILVAVALLVGVSTVGDAVGSAEAAGAFTVTRVGVESLVVLTVAVTAANLFHQGYWQRTWAAENESELRRGALMGAALTLPVVAIVGLLGAVAMGGEGIEQPSLALFTLFEGAATPVLIGFLLLAVALVTSSVDTLQNAMVALVADEVAERRIALTSARWLTVALFVPAVLISIQGLSVLRLFLIADLLAAATVTPVILGLWKRTRPAAAFVGAVAGLAAIVILGTIRTGTITEGLGLLTLPDGLDLGAFVVAPIAAAVVTVAGSLLRG